MPTPRKKLSEMTQDDVNEVAEEVQGESSSEEDADVEVPMRDSSDRYGGLARAEILGTIDGYQVKVFVYGEDMFAVEQGRKFQVFEPGIYHAIISDMKDLGIQPYWSKTKDEGSATARKVASTASAKPAGKPRVVSNSDWECPVHGAQYVNTDFFDKEKMICKYREVATEEEDGEVYFTDRPSWGKVNKDEEPFNTKGTYYWYCKHDSKRG